MKFFLGPEEKTLAFGKWFCFKYDMHFINERISSQTFFYPVGTPKQPRDKEFIIIPVLYLAALKIAFFLFASVTIVCRKLLEIKLSCHVLYKNLLFIQFRYCYLYSGILCYQRIICLCPNFASPGRTQTSFPLVREYRTYFLCLKQDFRFYFPGFAWRCMFLLCVSAAWDVLRTDASTDPMRWVRFASLLFPAAQEVFRILWFIFLQNNLYKCLGLPTSQSHW